MASVMIEMKASPQRLNRCDLHSMQLMANSLAFEERPFSSKEI